MLVNIPYMDPMAIQLGVLLFKIPVGFVEKFWVFFAFSTAVFGIPGVGYAFCGFAAAWRMQLRQLR